MKNDMCRHGIEYSACAECRIESVKTGYESAKEMERTMLHLKMASKRAGEALDAMRSCEAHVALDRAESGPIPEEFANLANTAVQVLESLWEVISQAELSFMKKEIEKRVLAELEKTVKPVDFKMVREIEGE